MADYTPRPPKLPFKPQASMLKGTLNDNRVIGAQIDDFDDVNINDASENDILIYKDGVWINTKIDTFFDTLGVVRTNTSSGEPNYATMDGGNAEGYVEEDTGKAGELSSALDTLIKSDAFKLSIASISGLDSVSMYSNNINIEMEAQFTGLMDIIYADATISSLMGDIVNGVYNNTTYTDIKEAINAIKTDLWTAFADVSKNSFNTTLFIYLSDASVVFYNINVKFV